MGEFKYIEGPALAIQKLLNQWKHKFNVNIIETEIKLYGELKETRIGMFLWREPRNPQQKENNDEY